MVGILIPVLPCPFRRTVVYEEIRRYRLYVHSFHLSFSVERLCKQPEGKLYLLCTFAHHRYLWGSDVISAESKIRQAPYQGKADLSLLQKVEQSAVPAPLRGVPCHSGLSGSLSQIRI